MFDRRARNGKSRPRKKSGGGTSVGTCETAWIIKVVGEGNSGTVAPAEEENGTPTMTESNVIGNQGRRGACRRHDALAGNRWGPGR